MLASLLVAITLVAGLLVSDAGATTPLRERLRIAQRELDKANHRLDDAKAALEAAQAAQDADPNAPTGAATAAAPPDVAHLQAEVDEARKDVREWERQVERLAAAVKQEEDIAAWEQKGEWMPIIKIAAAKYDVKADGIYRMMMRESGGDARAGSSSQFKGLFQYWTETWKNEWNPWRKDSIYDGSSQIFATAYAIHKGMGPQMWTTTFATQY
jgi:hypothetical protein